MKIGVTMKKFFVSFALLLACSTLVFARSSRNSRGESSSSSRSSNGGTSIHAFGFTVPVWGQTFYDTEFENDDVYWKFSAVGFNAMYHHLSIAPNGFSSFIDAEIGYISYDIDEVEFNGTSEKSSDMESMGGFNTRFILGLGGAPLNNDRVSLAIHGTFGVNLAYASYDESGSVYNSNYNATLNYTDEYSVFGFWTTLGVNVETAVKITGNFGVFGGMNMYINLFGFGTWNRETDVDYVGKMNDFNEFCLVYPGRFNIDFRFGVAFIF